MLKSSAPIHLCSGQQMQHTFSTYEEKRKASQEQFTADAGQTVSETTPATLSSVASRFATDLSTDAPIWLRVIDDPYGLYRWCSDGVGEKIRHDGGSILFGWVLWEWPAIMLTAEFHSVWVDPSDVIFDITPKPQGEKKILFIPDRSYTSGFDFDMRPRNRRCRIYEPPDPSNAAADKIARMTPAQRQYETKRASKVGLSLEAWIAGKEPKDLFARLIAEFIAVCDASEAKLDALRPGGGLVTADSEMLALAAKRMQLLEQLRAEVNRRGLKRVSTIKNPTGWATIDNHESPRSPSSPQEQCGRSDPLSPG